MNLFNKKLIQQEQELGDKLLTREYVLSNPDVLFLFTDNTNRTSGSNKIDPNSWYSKKYGNNLCYPNITQAVIRGLDNAYPISTQRYYIKEFLYIKIDGMILILKNLKKLLMMSFQISEMHGILLNTKEQFFQFLLEKYHN